MAGVIPHKHKMITVFLGAGFSKVGGVPLASQLFDRKPDIDRITRHKLIERVLSDWVRWQEKNKGQPEEYLAFLQEYRGQKWLDAVWYVSLVVALEMGRVERIGMNRTITRHNINRTTQIESHEIFWSTIFQRTYNVGVITTNYDILPERGLRCELRPRVSRPGFHYGNGTEKLAGGGYPSYAHIQKIAISGTVPILKLHGSVSWSFREGELIHYHDCRPAIRGDAAVVAPVTSKTLPKFLEAIWKQAAEVLSSSATWIVVGYSLPEYDLLVRQLLIENSTHQPRIHIFDPNKEVASKYKVLLPSTTILMHLGLPNGLGELESIVTEACEIENTV